jgi:hypothetical protein
MRLKSRKVALSTVVAIAVAVPLAVTIGTAMAGVSAQADPTAGWTSIPWNSSSYGVQNRTNAPLNQRERGSTKTAIMQVKSNADGEPVYIQVFNTNGDLRNDADGSALARSMYDKWFNLKCSSVHFKNIKLRRDDR